MLITASQIQWTTDVTKSLITSKERADRSALKSMKKKQVWRTFLSLKLKITTRNFKVFMKQSHDSSADFKIPVTANETLSEKTATFM